MKKPTTFFLLPIFFLFSLFQLPAQNAPQKVLFLGNSYTASNNLPAIVSAIASANGDSITYQAITPGGQYLLGHANDNQVHTAIQQGDWDYIIIQEQSQIPVIPHFRENLMYPGAGDLKTLRDQYCPGAIMYFFMTWGRENGGQQCNGGYCSHPFTDFADYQDTLTWAYQQSAIMTGCGIAPAGEIWREVILQNQPPVPTPTLFSADGSHPSTQGSYLTALTIYSTLFNKPVSNIPYSHPGIDPALDTYFKQITDANLWPRYTEWYLQPSLTYMHQNAIKAKPILHPNPTSEFIHIQSADPVLFVEIYDIFGRPVLKALRNTINIKNLQKGLYVAHIHFEDSQHTLKFLVE